MKTLEQLKQQLNDAAEAVVAKSSKDTWDVYSAASKAYHKELREGQDE